MYILGLVRNSGFSVSLAEDWLIHLKFMLFSLESYGGKVVWNSNVENAYLKPRSSAPRLLQSKSDEKATDSSDYAENQGNPVFPNAYNILVLLNY